MSDPNLSGDSSDLEALFDSIATGGAAATAPAASPAPAPAKPSLMQQAREGGGATDDSDDLQALFDSVASNSAPAQDPASPVASAEDGEEWNGQDKVFRRVGVMARQLHDTLSGLGYDKLVENTVSGVFFNSLSICPCLVDNCSSDALGI